jgi:hypothetical protein
MQDMQELRTTFLFFSRCKTPAFYEKYLRPVGPENRAYHWSRSKIRPKKSAVFSLPCAGRPLTRCLGGLSLSMEGPAAAPPYVALRSSKQLWPELPRDVEQQNILCAHVLEGLAWLPGMQVLLPVLSVIPCCSRLSMGSRTFCSRRGCPTGRMDTGSSTACSARHRPRP